MRRGASRQVLAWVARRVEPAHFAVVMATGILSAALRQAGLAAEAGALLGVALAAFLLVLSGVYGRAAGSRPGCWLGSLTRRVVRAGSASWPPAACSAPAWPCDAGRLAAPDRL